jgi:hypothetical protein
MDIADSDIVRINEIDSIENLFHENGISNHGMYDGKFCEIGFRVPKLMLHYHESKGMDPMGFDINPLCVEIAKKMGYKAQTLDLMSANDVIPNMSDASLVVCYHVLEHVSEPLSCLRKIYNNMSSGSYLHIEVPIEPSTPRLQYGHLFPFEIGDLKKIAEKVGFDVLTQSTQTHSGGPLIERHFMKK